MKDERIRLALLYGSDRPGRFCDTVAGWCRERVEAHGGFDVEAIDPADPRLRSGDRLPERVRCADAFVAVTPEYNHAYPASLKSIVDAVHADWQAKPVAFVSYGGLSGGLRAVEQLRLVFASLHAVPLRDGVCFPHAHDQFDEAGRLPDGHPAEAAMRLMLARLRWWAIALREARHAWPYERAVA